MKKGFTLAEVLITLGIIGVVAALMLPAIIANINEKVYAAREQNIVQKVTQAMNQMKALGQLSQTYDSTESFVNELTRYLKVIKVCDNSKIAECWPTKTVETEEDPNFDISKVKTSKDLSLNYKRTSNAVGLILADGAHIILAYDKDSKPLLETDAIISNGTSTSSASSIAFVMDVNGGRGPNKEDSKKDIRGFHGARFAKGNCNVTINNTCGYLISDNYAPVNCRSSNSSSDDYKYCGKSPSDYQKDYWAGANKACADLGMRLPEKNELSKLVYADIEAGKSGGKRQLPTDVSVWSANWYTTRGTFPSSGRYYYNYDAYIVDLSSGLANLPSRSASKYGVVCVE